MSAGNCPRCGGDGAHPSRHGAQWSIICLHCKGTGNFPPPTNPILAWYYRVTARIDAALDKLGVL